MFKISVLDILGQGCSLHLCVSESDPVQFAPPYCGRGLSHTRVRPWSAPPQVTAQGSHSVQLRQPPLTKENNLQVFNIIIV